MKNLIGQSLGRYHILEQLGEGGMAIVYKAFDTRLESEVAVKVIRTERLVPEQAKKTLKRFEREAKALAQLTHPNIVKVIDYGTHEEEPYLVMEYLPGGTLKMRMGGQPLPYTEAARTLLPIARALEYAHSQGMIHRDVKPSNILITHSGEPMLSDFGIAKLLDPEASAELTATGTGIGTPEYMSPEQATGSNLDQRADIYSLGIVYYEMVTGRKPYTADTPMAILFKHASEPLPRPKSFVPSLPDRVEHVLIKALAKSPADRYASMEDFADALEKLTRESSTQTIEHKLKAAVAPKPASARTPAQDPNLTVTELVSGETKKLGWGFWSLWFLVALIGAAPGIFIQDAGSTSGYIFPLMGLILGVGQWLLLRDKIQKAGGWILSTLIAWSLLAIPAVAINRGGAYYFCGVLDSYLTEGQVYISQAGNTLYAQVTAGTQPFWWGFMCDHKHWFWSQLFAVGGLGLVLGFSQWLALRKKIKRAGMWIAANTFAWSLGIVPVGMAFSNQYAQGWFILAGFFYAVISGWGMVWLLNQDWEDRQRG